MPSIAVSEGMFFDKTLGVYDCPVGTLEGYEFSSSVGMLDGCSNTECGNENDDITDDGVTLVPSFVVSEVKKLLKVYGCTIGTLEGYEFSIFVYTLDGFSNADGS